MQGAVVWRNGARILPPITSRANGQECEGEIQGPHNVPVPVEPRLLDLGGRRRFDGCRGRCWCRHAGRRAHCATGTGDQDEQECKTRPYGQCPPKTGPPTHQNELSRN